jgi:ribonuclease-3
MIEIDNKLQEFEVILGVQFQELELLKRALTHRSYVNEAEVELRDNDRLEFLGDAILDFIVGDMLFRRFVDVSEGELTQLRAALVRTDSLAMLAADCRLGEFLLMGKGEENSGGRNRINNLCCGFEAMIAAMYMDGGLEMVKDFAIPRLEKLLEYVLEHNLHKDARSMLQEQTQAELRVTPSYRVVDASGPDHEKEFFIEVIVGGVVIGAGVGSSKRSAAQSAARAALQRLEEIGFPDEAQLVLKPQEEISAEKFDAPDMNEVTPEAS